MEMIWRIVMSLHVRVCNCDKNYRVLGRYPFTKFSDISIVEYDMSWSNASVSQIQVSMKAKQSWIWNDIDILIFLKLNTGSWLRRITIEINPNENISELKNTSSKTHCHQLS